ncbi:uncharacterized protein LOC127079442 [Lathyrus oleraceus]|uniref:uncharacterized protein LOC127079442 n=1 Tax=Pisum sativum TaxID=3888 RepID=UPI0021D32DC9|nr:uncharacterized protein LOC127079442 [Pisum sativum]
MDRKLRVVNSELYRKGLVITVVLIRRGIILIRLFITTKKINRKKETLQRDMEASFENLTMQLGLVSSQLALKLSSSGEFDGKVLDIPEDKEIEREFQQECEVVDEGRIEKKKEEEKCTPFDKEIEARIKEVNVKIICGKRTRMEWVQSEVTPLEHHHQSDKGRVDQTKPTLEQHHARHLQNCNFSSEQMNHKHHQNKDWTKEGIGHVKIRCKGRDSVPDDESVQKLCNEVLNFCSQRPNTKKFDFKIITIEFDGKRIKLQTWDTAGQERFRTITTAYYRGAMDILLVYDVTDKASFNNIRNWIRNIEQHASDNVNKILVGNKADMDESKRVVPTSKGQALADEYGIKFFETSAKTNMNVEEVFFPIARDIKQRLADTDSGSEPPAAFPNATIGLQCAP